jgi:hypothetical protein
MIDYARREKIKFITIRGLRAKLTVDDVSAQPGSDCTKLNSWIYALHKTCEVHLVHVLHVEHIEHKGVKGFIAKSGSPLCLYHADEASSSLLAARLPYESDHKIGIIQKQWN